MLKENKLKSVILGHAVGDALGVPVQFKYRDYFDNTPYFDMSGYTNYPFPPGTWSDDTSMSLCALKSLIDKKDIDYRDIMNNFCKWFFDNDFTPCGECFDVGMTCQIAITNYKFNTNNNPILCGLADEYSNGNGSLMRINPFVLYLYYTKRNKVDYIDIIHNASALTHRHIRSKMACGIYSFVLWELLDNPTKLSIEKGLMKAKKFYHDYEEIETYKRLFNEIGKINTLVKRDDIKSSGYVVDTLEASIWCVMTTNNYKECVLKAVNLGGDTDTIAAIAGGLCGALYGYESIPKKWLDTLGKKEYLQELLEKVTIEWNC